MFLFQREFQKEISLKEQEALQIEDEVIKTKRLLQKLRYVIVANYYKNGSGESQMQAQKSFEANSVVPSSNVLQLDQQPIHPSLKKLIGKKPINYSEILENPRSRRKAAQEALNNMNDKINVSKPKKTETITTPVEIERTQGRNIAQLTSSRGRNQIKHTLVVGNTSKYLDEEPTSSMTHKWMCYLKTKSSIPIEGLVKKARFHLDPSYKPNDVIDVTSPPFHLTRRGFGEFTIKILIFFKDEVDLKPVQIFHRLALDKEFSGRQMMGNETVTELWTRDFLKDERADNQDQIAHLMDHDYYKAEMDSNKNS